MPKYVVMVEREDGFDVIEEAVEAKSAMTAVRELRERRSEYRKQTLVVVPTSTLWRFVADGYVEHGYA